MLNTHITVCSVKDNEAKHNRILKLWPVEKNNYTYLFFLLVNRCILAQCNITAQVIATGTEPNTILCAGNDNYRWDNNTRREFEGDEGKCDGTISSTSELQIRHCHTNLRDTKTNRWEWALCRRILTWLAKLSKVTADSLKLMGWHMDNSIVVSILEITHRRPQTACQLP